MKKKAKNLISWGVGLAVLAGIVTLIAVSGGGDTNSTAYSAGALVATETSFDFGTISMKNGVISHQFELKNDGPEPVVIEKVYTSCMCTTASIKDPSGKQYGNFGMPGHGLPSKTNIKINPGEVVELEAIFDPNAHGPSGVGLAQRSIYLETNSAKSPKLELKFQAMVTR